MSEDNKGATENTAFRSSGPRDGKTVSHMLGEITWLLTQSKRHRTLFIGDLEWMVMPAILMEQFRLYYGPNSPAAVALFAFVSEETDKRLRQGGDRLRPEEWKGGDIPWLIELVAPFGREDQVLPDLLKHIFNGESFNFHEIKNGERVVTQFTTEDAKTIGKEEK